MASSSVLKTAAVFMLALFAAQLLMATTAAAGGLGNRRSLYDGPPCGGHGYDTCNTVCYAIQYQLCIVDPTCTVKFCVSKAFGICKYN